MSLKYIKLHKITLVLLVLAITTLALHFLFHDVRILGIEYSIFYLDEDKTIAALLTSSIAIFSSLLFIYYLIKKESINLNNLKQNFNNKKNLFKYLIYSFVAFFFLFLAFDEYFSIHEYLNQVVKDSITTDSVFNNIERISWIIPLSVLILIALLGLTLLIIIEKNSYIKNSYIFGIIAFILILVLEIIGGRLYGQSIYLVFVGIEEFLEIVGVTLFFNGIILKNE